MKQREKEEDHNNLNDGLEAVLGYPRYWVSWIIFAQENAKKGKVIIGRKKKVESKVVRSEEIVYLFFPHKSICLFGGLKFKALKL